MLVSLDGGETYQPAVNGVRVMYENQIIPGEDESGDVHFNFTEEGLIQDIWVNRGDESHNISTNSVMIDEIVQSLIEDND